MNAKRPLAEYYNRYADVYEKKHGVDRYGQIYNFKNYYQPFLVRALPRLQKILELGCGTGIYTQWLVECGHSVTGIDISPEMLKWARRRCPAVAFYEGNCENPEEYLSRGVVGNGLDAILGVNTFSYLPNKETALRNYRKLLRPGGRLILLDMNGASPYYPVMAWMNKNEMREWIGPVKESNQKHLALLFERTGFRIDTLEHFAFIPNGVGRGVVALLRPIDFLLHSMPGIKNLAMRIALAAVKQ